MSKFLEESYISQLIGDGYLEVGFIDLPDGIYYKYSGGYEFTIHASNEPHSNSNYYTGFTVITNDGIRGSWNGDEVEIKNGLVVGENVYKVMTDRLDIIREEKIEELLK